MPPPPHYSSLRAASSFMGQITLSRERERGMGMSSVSLGEGCGDRLELEDWGFEAKLVPRGWEEGFSGGVCMARAFCRGVSLNKRGICILIPLVSVYNSLMEVFGFPFSSILGCI